MRLEGGALLDPPGAAGASDLLAALLERGAGERDARAFKEAIEAAGGRLRVSARKRWPKSRPSSCARTQRWVRALGTCSCARGSRLRSSRRSAPRR
ncbi:MAG: hypothetical protein R3F62_26330 [Planctomycetota bacterium]